ncbi:MAG: B12-binding domain-containing radical SAM protein, partial [Lachnospiraceae bacterium]|nr:B12-binding domain-containing radical SAM protein [Lachnospiraceae bacterium]
LKEEMKAQLNQKSLHYQWHPTDLSVLEGVFARGDRRIGAVIKKAYESGALFDAWSEFFDLDKWTAAFAECGIDPDFYTMRERPLDEILPWDFIDTGVEKRFLKAEWERAMQAAVTPPCRERCSGCGCTKYQSGVCVA